MGVLSDDISRHRHLLYAKPGLSHNHAETLHPAGADLSYDHEDQHYMPNVATHRATSISESEGATIVDLSSGSSSELLSSPPSSSTGNCGVHEHDSSGQEVKMFCVDIGRHSRCWQLLLLATGVFAFHIGAAAVQELIFQLPGFKPFGWYLAMLSFGIYGAYGCTEMRLQRYGVTRIPLKTHVHLAVLTTISRGLPIAALGVLNYPTMLIFKSCKLIPVLLAGIVIQGKKVRALDLMAATLMTVGLVFFGLADSKVMPNFNPKGYIYMCIAVAADAFMSNIQEKALKQHKAGSCEVVAYSYGSGCFMIACALLITGEFFEATKFCESHLIQTYGYAAFYSTLGYFGIILCLTMVKTFSAFLTITVTTLRKAVTIVLSFLLFTKPFTLQYVWAGLLVLTGVSLSDFSKVLGLEDRLNSWLSNFRNFLVATARLDCLKMLQGKYDEIDEEMHRNGCIGGAKKALRCSKSCSPALPAACQTVPGQCC